MTGARPLRVLVLGASGRLGMILRRHWAGTARVAPIWQCRTHPSSLAADTVIFDPLRQRPECGPVDLVLGLAGIVPGRGDLTLNTDLAVASIRLAAQIGARQVLVSSSAAVYGGGQTLFSETDPACPVSAYGRAKLDMEQAALTLGRELGVSVTALRIGNVAGADALLAGAGNDRVLDNFAQGAHRPTAACRSYVGPAAFAQLVGALVEWAGQGGSLPARLNLALEGGVDMADLCAAAGWTVTWRPAPAHALAYVVQDVRALAQLVPVPQADARAIVADWRADQALAEWGAA